MYIEWCMDMRGERTVDTHREGNYDVYVRSCEENSVVMESDYEYYSYNLLFVRWCLT